jgi:uncharacterized delta-60 repeat protein
MPYINPRFALARYNTDGSLDTTFSSDGKSTAGSGSIYGLAIDASGRIVAAGTGSYGYAVWALARFNANGSLDSSFSDDGLLVTSFGVNTDAHGNALVIDATGKIVVAGYATIPSFLGPRQFVLARYASNGNLDTSFSSDGKAMTDFTQHEGAFAVAIDASSRIVAAGHALNGNRFAVARYLSNGNLDSSFSGDGKVTTEFAGSTYAIANAVAIDASDKIVVAGIVVVNGKGRFGLARYTASGNLDTLFSSDGKVITDFGADVYASARAVAIDASGKIVVAGSAGGQFALARYNPDGSLDATFSSDGKATTSFGANIPVDARAVAIGAGGKIVVAGEATVNDRYQFALARYNPDGSLDTTFSSDGKLQTSFIPGGGAQAQAVAIDASGRIVAGGWASEWGNFPPG